ncbi:MAG: phospholipase D-like domain-containing protein [Chthoniobacterales bacterium]
MSHSIHPKLIIQPDDGVPPVKEFIDSAKKTLLLKQFTFTEVTIMDAVKEAKDRGVDVRIMLNPHRSSGSRANDETFEWMQKAGVNIQWASPKFAVTHEKSIVVDGERAMIATYNLCEKYFTQTRDYGIIVDDPRKVKQVVEAFEADWKHEDFHPDRESGLLWSNANSRHLMCDFIDSATTMLAIQHPKFVDATVLDRIIAARVRGVHVRVLCGGRHGISDWDVLDTFSSLRVLHRFDVKVHKQKNLRLHAKLIIVDESRALVGSMNIDRSAFDLRRELGVFVEEPEMVTGLQKVFMHDWAESKHYDTPDPLSSEPHPDDQDFPHDPDLVHE